jgi:phage terminase small subunit|tara:strand:- start:15 stop:419 length:405 start_codon:yes stop_codon:yes gene_type:complete
LLTEKQSAFIKEFALSGNGTQSAIKAGYSEKTAYQKAHQLKYQFTREIEEETRRLMQSAVPGALAQIVDLASTATSEQVRLQAAKDIMDRAGLKPTERIEQVTIEKSTDELRRELAQLMGTTAEEEEEIPQMLN